MNYYEIEFSNGNEDSAEWMCIKGVKEPSVDDAANFCKHEAAMWGLPVKGVYPIDERTAKSCYDFTNESNWPVFGV